MLDIAYIRENEDAVQKAANAKRAHVDIGLVIELDKQRRALQGKIDNLKKSRNELSRTIGKDPSLERIEEGKNIKSEIDVLEQKMRTIQQQYENILEDVPNLPTNDTPIGKDESDNVELRSWGEKPAFSFQPRPHWEIGKELNIIDSARASFVSGSRFAYIKGPLVQVQFALLRLAIDVTTDATQLQQIIKTNNLHISSKPFVPVLPPLLITRSALQKMARLKPEEERYHIPTDNLFLIGSAEHSLGPMHADETMPESQLPIRYIGYSASFRREAGSHGKDVRGILRMHQFDKVEMESFAVPDESTEEQNFFVAIQEHLVRLLQIPYRVVLMCTGDMGFPDARQIDIETWMPGQNAYRETHSADLVTDFQARRLNTKVLRKNGARQYVHMNDATAFAMGRTLIALLENYQREDGSVVIPRILHQYLPFTEISRP